MVGATDDWRRDARQALARLTRDSERYVQEAAEAALVELDRSEAEEDCETSRDQVRPRYRLPSQATLEHALFFTVERGATELSGGSPGDYPGVIEDLVDLGDPRAVPVLIERYDASTAQIAELEELIAEHEQEAKDAGWDPTDTDDELDTYVSTYGGDPYAEIEDHRETCAAALEAVGKLDPNQAYPFLVRQIGRGDDLAECAAGALARIVRPSQLAQLRSDWESAVQEDVAIMLVPAMVKMGEVDALSVAYEMARAEHCTDRLQAVWALHTALAGT